MKYLTQSILTLSILSASSAHANMQDFSTDINFNTDMTLSGDAYIKESHVSNGVILTPNSYDKVGSAFTNLSYDNIERFTAKFEMKLGGGKEGSGLTFAWVTNPNAPTSSDGKDLGFSGLTGYAVEFDTYASAGYDNGSSNHIAIVQDSTDNALLQTEVTDFNLSDNRYRNVEIEFDSGIISVEIDGKNYVDNFSIENYDGFDGYFGFTAATGGSTSDWHKVRNFNLAVSPIPEPSTYALMLGGLGMVGFMAYRRRKQQINA